jgi:hypothetical protein
MDAHWTNNVDDMLGLFGGDREHQKRILDGNQASIRLALKGSRFENMGYGEFLSTVFRARVAFRPKLRKLYDRAEETALIIFEHTERYDKVNEPVHKSMIRIFEAFMYYCDAYDTPFETTLQIARESFDEERGATDKEIT